MTDPISQTDDWALETRAFQAAADDSAPAETCALVKDLWKAYCDMEIARDAMRNRAEQAERFVKQRDHLADLSRKYWIRASESAMAGDFRELRNRVDLARAPPTEFVLSDPSP